MKQYLSLIKFSHTIFALPFAILGFTLASIESHAAIDWRLFILVILCMVFARSAAMAFNRYLDRDIDAKNPRTAIREIPAGIINANSALIFIVINCLLFSIATYFINSLCFYLSPVALLIVLGYSYTKRFTALCHVILGLGLSLAPIGAYLAVTSQFSVLPILYSAAVLCWVAGFDIIYALQDESFDAEHGLHSIPVFFGKNRALVVSRLLHFICAAFILFAAFNLHVNFPSVGWIHWIASSFFIALLIYQHLLVSPSDLSKINLAFFTTNGFASIIFCGLVILDFLS